MEEASFPKGAGLSDRCMMVAMITMARYLAAKDVDFVAFMLEALQHAKTSSLADADLAALDLLISAICG